MVVIDYCHPNVSNTILESKTMCASLKLIWWHNACDSGTLEAEVGESGVEG